MSKIRFSIEIFDFEYLKRPIIFYAADHDEYLQESRSLNFKLDEVYHHIAKNDIELKRILSSVKELKIGLKISMSGDNKVGTLSKNAYEAIFSKIDG